MLDLFDVGEMEELVDIFLHILEQIEEFRKFIKDNVDRVISLAEVPPRLLAELLG